MQFAAVVAAASTNTLGTVAVAEHVAAERVAAERVAAERVAAERVAAERVAAERVAAVECVVAGKHAVAVAAENLVLVAVAARKKRKK